jgi:alkylhydroperoxidase family enzyme
MARVPYLDADDIAEVDRPLLDRPGNLFRALANSPEGLRRFLGQGYWIRNQSQFDPRLREMTILQVGYAARSPYEFSHHVKIGRDFGVTDRDIEAIVAESEGRPSELSDVEKAVLRGARQLTLEGSVTPPTWEVLASELSPEHLVDFVLIASFYAQVVRVLAALEVDVEPEYQPYLEQFPLPDR